ncbi:MAG: dienelactone hydrolase family protein [Acidimicrobiales bacterium]|jgi:carboxymethylenebutenolidase
MTDSLRAETVRVTGHKGDGIEAYLAQPLEKGRFGSVVVIHHMPGYDEGSKEIARKFAAHGYLAICPNLYSREAPGASPEEASAAARALGGVPDDRLVGDVEGCIRLVTSLPSSNGRVATIGYCSGGRQSFLAACSLPLDAVVDCYGAFVVGTPPEGSPLKVTPIVHMAKDLSCPLLGLFGADDQHPSPDDVHELESVLKQAGKSYEFHIYEGAGHAFFATDRPTYRPEVAKDGWARIWSFFGDHLAGEGG